jgi:protein tyrosine/serine phosphatase
MRAFSKYCLAEITFSLESVSLRAKSLTTHKKEGNNFYTSSGSQSSRSSDFIYSSLERLMISEILFKALSSIVPILL